MAEISLTGNLMLLVLEVVAKDGPLSASKVATIAGLNRTVAHRLLTTLAERAYVRKGLDGYVVGPALIRLAQVADVGLRSVAKPIMRRLSDETGETVVLHGIDNLQAIVIDQELGRKNLVRVEHSPGSKHPLYKGASGWALLAYQDEKLIAHATNSEDIAVIKSRLASVRQHGHAISHDELQQGAHGIAVPILTGNTRCDASLAILVPTARAVSLKKFLKPLQKAAKAIGSQL